MGYLDGGLMEEVSFWRVYLSLAPCSLYFPATILW
jgi:hypothetical protein